MESSVPSLDFWPKLRRRIKERKLRKAKSKFNFNATQGLEKFSVVYAELQARRDAMVERIKAPVLIIRYMSRSSRQPALSNDSEVSKDVVVASDHCHEERVSFLSSSEVFSEADVNKSNPKDATVQFLAGEIDFGRQGGECVANESVDSVEESVDFDKSLEVDQQGVGLVFKRCDSSISSRGVGAREILLSDSFGRMESRGRKGSRSCRRSMCGREKRWRQVKRTAVTFFVIFGIIAEKSANLAGSILAALLLGVISPCRRGKQHLCRLLSDLVIYLQGHLYTYISGLASKRLDSGISHVEEEKKCHTEASSPSLATRPGSPCLASNASSLPVVGTSVSPEPCTRLFSSATSPESCSSPSNKLSQLKTKMLKSFSHNKSSRDFRAHRASSMPPNPTGCENYHESLGSRSERWASNSATAVEDIEVRSISPLDGVMKKKSFLQRRSMSGNNDEVSSSFSKSRFGNLRVNISHSRDDFVTTSPADSSRSLCIGNLRISTSMKESPRRSVGFCSTRPCSPRECKQRANTSTMESSRMENATPRHSGLNVASPFPAELGAAIRGMKQRHKHEAFLLLIFLVALLFLILGRAPAVLATSLTLMFLSQLDRFQQSGGTDRDKDHSRHSMPISRKLRTSESSIFSPRLASPHTLCSPRSKTPRPNSKECRRSICMGQFLQRKKRS